MFIDSGNVLPTNVVISFDNDTVLKNNNTSIVIPDRSDAGWVIDGQHRLAGAHKSKNDIILPIVAFIGLSIEEQIDCFVTINREQVGVPSSLYYQLLKKLPGNKSEGDLIKERAADLASALRKDESSPFSNRIVMTTSPKRGEISLANFVRKLSPMLKRDTGSLANFSEEDRKGILNNYYIALKQVFPKEYEKSDSIFFKTLGFGALINVLPFVFHACIQHYHGFRVADVVSLFSKIDYFDFYSWHQRGTGNAAENAAGDDLRTVIQGAFATSSQPGAVKLK